MPKMIIRFEDSGLTKKEAKEFAEQNHATLTAFQSDSKSKQSFLDLTLEDYYHGNELLEEYSDIAQGYLQFKDGTVSRHFIRKERNFAED